MKFTRRKITNTSSHPLRKKLVSFQQHLKIKDPRSSPIGWHKTNVTEKRNVQNLNCTTDISSNSLPRTLFHLLRIANRSGTSQKSGAELIDPAAKYCPFPSALSFPLFDARSRAFGFDTLEPLIKQSLAPRFPSRVIKESSHVEQTSQPRYIFFRGPSRLHTHPSIRFSLCLAPASLNPLQPTWIR